METIHITSKVQMMDTLEKYYIFSETKLSNQINDRVTANPNIFSVPQYAMTPQRVPQYLQFVVIQPSTQ